MQSSNLFQGYSVKVAVATLFFVLVSGTMTEAQEAIHTRYEIDFMTCQELTKDESAIDGKPRDEVFFVVVASSPLETTTVRVPQKNYFEGRPNTTVCGKVTLWEGKIPGVPVPGENYPNVKLTVFVYEQDNGDLKTLVGLSVKAGEKIGAAIGAALAGPEAAKAIATAVGELGEVVELTLNPKKVGKHDLIGVFHVTLENRSGTQDTQYKMIHQSKILEGGNAATLELRGAGSKYRLGLRHPKQ